MWNAQCTNKGLIHKILVILPYTKNSKGDKLPNQRTKEGRNGGRVVMNETNERTPDGAKL